MDHLWALLQYPETWEIHGTSLHGVLDFIEARRFGNDWAQQGICMYSSNGKFNFKSIILMYHREAHKIQKMSTFTASEHRFHRWYYTQVFKIALSLNRYGYQKKLQGVISACHCQQDGFPVGREFYLKKQHR